MVTTWSRSTRQRDEAAEFLRLGFPRLGLSARGDEDFGFLHWGASDERMSVQRLVISGTGTTAGQMTVDFAVARLDGGRAALTYDHHVVDTSQPYLRPSGRSEMRFEHPSLSLLTFEPEQLRAEAGRYLDGTGRRLVMPGTAATAPVSAAAARTWDATMRYVSELAHDPEIYAFERLRAQVYDLVVRTFLISFPVTVDTATVPQARSTVLPATIRRAIDHIDTHLAEPVSAANLAEQARLSVRALHEGFRKHTGSTPMTYLRERRLARVRQELLTADPAVTKVADVARAWGFAHLPRFSASYFEAFGEYPSQTLRG